MLILKNKTKQYYIVCEKIKQIIPRHLLAWNTIAAHHINTDALYFFLFYPFIEKWT